MTLKNDRRVEITLTADEKQRGDSIISGDMDKIEEKKNDNVIVGVQAVKRDIYENGQKIDDASKTITQPDVLLEILLPSPAESLSLVHRLSR